MSEAATAPSGEAARPVAVVVDSTADLPSALAARHGIAVVPLIVRFGERSFRDGVEITPARFLEELRASSVSPSTSQPAVTDFETVFRPALDAGKAVACFTIAAALSGTHNAARLAAEALGLGDGAWTLARGERSVAAVLGLAGAGVRDGERLDLRRL